MGGNNRRCNNNLGVVRMKTTETLDELGNAIDSCALNYAQELLTLHRSELAAADTANELQRFADFFWGFVTCLFLCVCALGVYYAFR